MSDVAIQIEGLTKRYRIGHRAPYHRFTELLSGMGTRAWQRLTRRQTASSHAQPEEEWFLALDNVSFNVMRGEVVGIAGPNGAGKSTLLKILSRITDPTAGQAIIRGSLGSLLEVGTGFHPELTGRENVYLNGVILGMPRSEIRRKFDEIVAFAETERFLDTPVKHYSSGMYMRLAFAVAAHLDPEILIVDEVLAVGDMAFQRKCLGKMGDLARAGRTVLFVSHNMQAIRKMCSSVVLLEGGRISKMGYPDDVLAQYEQDSLKLLLSRTWDDLSRAPGNDEARLVSVCVRPPEDGSGSFRLSDPVYLEIEAQSFVPDLQLNVSAVLYTSEDTCAFNVISRPWIVEPGRHRWTCEIPAHFLNDDKYRVRVLLVKDCQIPLADVETVTFEVVEGHRPGPWQGKWIGAVRPVFQWRQETVVEAPSELAKSQ